MTIFANIWNRLESSQPASAQALCGTALAAVDQWGKCGRLDIGYLFTHLPEPAWGSLSRPSNSGQLEPFTNILPQSWSAVTAAYLRDVEALEDRFKKDGRRRPEKNKEKPPPPVKPPGGAADKHKAGGAGGAGANTKA